MLLFHQALTDKHETKDEQSQKGNRDKNDNVIHYHNLIAMIVKDVSRKPCNKSRKNQE
jgi:hypothetical protein